MNRGTMISINPPWTDKIFSGYKKFECRKLVTRSVTPGSTIYIYETKNGGGSGKVIGQAIVKDVWMSCRGIYAYKSLNGGMKSPSELFEGVMFDLVGFGHDNYLVELQDVIKYDQPKELNQFTYTSYGYMFTAGGTQKYEPTSPGRMKRPPQNMCEVIEVIETEGKDDNS